MWIPQFDYLSTCVWEPSVWGSRVPMKCSVWLGRQMILYNFSDRGFSIESVLCPQLETYQALQKRVMVFGLKGFNLNFCDVKDGHARWKWGQKKCGIHCQADAKSPGLASGGKLKQKWNPKKRCIKLLSLLAIFNIVVPSDVIDAESILLLFDLGRERDFQSTLSVYL